MTETIALAAEEIRRQIEAKRQETHLSRLLPQEAKLVLRKNAVRSLGSQWITPAVTFPFDDGQRANVYLISLDHRPKLSKVDNFALRFDLSDGVGKTSTDFAQFRKGKITNFRGESPNLEQLTQIDIMVKFLEHKLRNASAAA